MSATKITVGIPTFNRAGWLREAIESVLAQTFTSFRLIVSDNAGVQLSKIGGGVKVDVKRSDAVRVVKASGRVEVTGRGPTWSWRTFRKR